MTTLATIVLVLYAGLMLIIVGAALEALNRIAAELTAANLRANLEAEERDRLAAELRGGDR